MFGKWLNRLLGGGYWPPIREYDPGSCRHWVDFRVVAMLLGRYGPCRGKIVVGLNDALDEKKALKTLRVGLALASKGLGLFDPFFASFSMILVSEIGVNMTL
ncbi:hypothetical protein RJ641_008795 [Dillenia turbinata]|uniref:Uncharacterized protein n=1 Tax=Dillenia turbinata TaxID=194707 RepID=A0AAN8Z6U4_9MAGN